jgi:uncharacterized membrane-anchored protein YitT (DUF2179 family)
MLVLAGIINSVGVNLFLSPVGLYDGGLSGTAMLLAKLTPDWLSLSVFLLFLNFPFYVFGWKRMGTSFTLRSLFTVHVYSLTSFLLLRIFSADLLTSSPFAGQDLFLCAVFGGAISGIGSGLTIRFGGAIDGIEVMAVIFAKRLGLTVGTFVMIYNAVLYVVAGCIFRDWRYSLYSIVTYLVGIKTVDFIVEGLDKAKSALIVTSNSKEITEVLSQSFGVGSTVIEASGGFSGQPKTIVYFVVNRFQIPRMNRMVQKIDPDAFITVSEVSDVLRSSLK